MMPLDFRLLFFTSPLERMSNWKEKSYAKETPKSNLEV